MKWLFLTASVFFFIVGGLSIGAEHDLGVIYNILAAIWVLLFEWRINS
jgi:hypothetical protein